MIKYTTPTFRFNFASETGVDFSEVDASDIVFSLWQPNGAKITKTGENLVVSGSMVDATLTQNDSVNLALGTALVQLNWIQNGRRAATPVSEVPITRNLLEEIMGND